MEKFIYKTLYFQVIRKVGVLIMDNRNKSLLFLTSGIVFVVSFIAIAGLLTNVISLWKIIWELAFLIIGALIIRKMVSRAAFFYSIIFYAVNLIIVVILQVMGVGSVFFSTLAILLLAVGFVLSIFGMGGRKRKPLSKVREEVNKAFEEIHPVETYPAPKKAKKKAVKKKKK